MGERDRLERKNQSSRISPVRGYKVPYVLPGIGNGNLLVCSFDKERASSSFAGGCLLVTLGRLLPLHRPRLPKEPTSQVPTVGRFQLTLGVLWAHVALIGYKFST